MSRSIYLFWDNSNIFIPAKYVASRIEGQLAEQAVRIQFDQLYELAHMRRNVAKAICVGSVPPELERVWTRLRSTGVEVELFERGAESRKEQGVDQCLQVHMLRAIADASEPGIAVLLTGDGAGYDDGIGFHADLERMQKHGWGIEVLSWDRVCKGALKEWAAKIGVYVPLDDYYEYITFLESLRKCKPLGRKKRATVE